MKISKEPNVPYVIVDTNILIRAILKPTSSDGQIYKLFLRGKIRLYYSTATLQELKRVLEYARIKKKYRIEDETIKTLLETVAAFGEVIFPLKRITLCRDEDDNELLSVAYSIYHDKPVYIVTADEDLLVLKDRIKEIVILTPQDFLRSMS